MTTTTETQHPSPSYSEPWITDTAWISGLAGALMTIFCGYYFDKINALNEGLYLFGWKFSHNRDETVLWAVAFITLSMIFVEIIRLYIWNPKIQLQRSPLIQKKQYTAFFQECLRVFVLNGLLIGLAVLIYKNVPQHAAWNLMIDIVSWGYLILGLPYIAITRAYQHNESSDKTDYPNLVSKSLWFMLSLAPGQGKHRPQFGLSEQKSALGLAVKLFFAPLMTSFFFNQFPFLASNIGYLLDGLPNKISNGTYTHKIFNKDIINVSKSFIFSIDVALAWCGYIISSRWLDNQTKSAEPTLLGWFVCMLSYPPFQLIGLYFIWPSENSILGFDNLWAVSFFSILSILSFVFYTSATVFFGVRFSNLTNRGIIRKGPFAIIRHPAYASKNFSWWCVVFPAIIMNIENSGVLKVFVFTIGLGVQSWIYYLRAITEERHLSADPQYLEYCKQVKYRFIPGVI